MRPTLPLMQTVPLILKNNERPSAVTTTEWQDSKSSVLPWHWRTCSQLHCCLHGREGTPKETTVGISGAVPVTLLPAMLSDLTAALCRGYVRAFCDVRRLAPQEKLGTLARMTEQIVLGRLYFDSQYVYLMKRLMIDKIYKGINMQSFLYLRGK